jgi:hypothetical protein
MKSVDKDSDGTLVEWIGRVGNENSVQSYLRPNVGDLGVPIEQGAQALGSVPLTRHLE